MCNLKKRKSMLRSPYYHLTFCTTLTGTSTFLNISVPLQASSSAISCGVVTITAPAQMCISIQNYYLGPISAEAINRFCWKDSPLGWLMGTNEFSLNPIKCRVIDLVIDQAPVVWKVDNAIHWINFYSMCSALPFSSTYLLDSNVSVK